MISNYVLQIIEIQKVENEERCPFQATRSISMTLCAQTRTSSILVNLYSRLGTPARQLHSCVQSTLLERLHKSASCDHLAISRGGRTKKLTLESSEIISSLEVVRARVNQKTMHHCDRSDILKRSPVTISMVRGASTAIGPLHRAAMRCRSRPRTHPNRSP